MSFETKNPYTGQIITTKNFASREQWSMVLQQAQTAFHGWRKIPLQKRIEEVSKGLAYFKNNQRSLAEEVTQHMGKPFKEALREIDTLLDRGHYLMTHAAEYLAPEVLPFKENFTRKIEASPLGVVLEIAPWNYPYLIPANVVITSILAGNAVVLKHSERTPQVGTHFARAFGRLTVPGVVQALDLTHADVAEMMQDSRINSVIFTGSVKAGRQIYRQAAEKLLPVTLELGGKDPAYVAEDANLDYAAENIVDGACYNAGQSCCAVERVYVHQKLYAAFIERAQHFIGTYQLGDPLLETTTLGPIANPSNLRLLEEHVEDALALGAKLLHGGKCWPDKDGPFFEPTLLVDVPQKARVMQEESFGPIVPVQKVQSDQEALTKMNDSDYGLTASIWTNSEARADWFAQRLECGTIYQNRCDYLDPALPWSGQKQSGFGASLSRWGFYQVTHRKSYHFRSIR